MAGDRNVHARRGGGARTREPRYPTHEAIDTLERLGLEPTREQLTAALEGNGLRWTSYRIYVEDVLVELWQQRRGLTGMLTAEQRLAARYWADDMLTQFGPAHRSVV